VAAEIEAGDAELIGKLALELLVPAKMVLRPSMDKEIRTL